MTNFAGRMGGGIGSVGGGRNKGATRPSIYSEPVPASIYSQDSSNYSEPFPARIYSQASSHASSTYSQGFAEQRLGGE